MRLGELKGVKRWLPTHPTAGDPLWQRDVFAVTEMEIQFFYARSGTTFRSDAIEAIDALQAAVITAMFEGEIVGKPSAIVLHETPQDPFFVDELVDGLIRLRPERRKACLFALDMRWEPTDVMELTWTKARQLRQATRFAVEIIEAAGKTRHLMLPYVFWENATNTIATPLLELQWSTEQAFDCSWPELVGRYRRMIMVCREANAANLLSVISQ